MCILGFFRLVYCPIFYGCPLFNQCLELNGFAICYMNWTLFYPNGYCQCIANARACFRQMNTYESVNYCNKSGMICHMFVDLLMP